MTPHSPEKQLDGLMAWFKAKAANGEPFSDEGAAHFLSCLRELGRGVKAMRQVVDDHARQSRQVESLKLQIAVLELREAELSGAIKPKNFLSKPKTEIIPIQ